MENNHDSDSPMKRFEDLGRKLFQAPKDEPEELEEETTEEPERDPSDDTTVEE